MMALEYVITLLRASVIVKEVTATEIEIYYR